VSELNRLQREKLAREAGGQEREEDGKDAGLVTGTFITRWLLAFKMTIFKDF
jgi:hypothetical protein